MYSLSPCLLPVGLHTLCPGDYNPVSPVLMPMCCMLLSSPDYRERRYEAQCFLRHSVKSYQLHRREDAPGAAHGHSDMPAQKGTEKL